jgi:glycosyltransferase involved in cell wall biosynthesis
MSNIVVFSAGFNPTSFSLEKHFYTLFRQTANNIKHIVVDDCSTENVELIKEYSQIESKTHEVIYYRNEENRGWLWNAVNILTNEIKDDDIVILYDLDDWFPHKNCIQEISETFKNSGCWLYSGSYDRKDSLKDSYFVNHFYPDDVVKNKTFREYYPWSFTHPRCFKGFLWNYINFEDFIDPETNKYAMTTYDCAVFFPMMEMTPYNKFHQQKSKSQYVYNCIDDNHDEKRWRNKQAGFGQVLRKKEKYKELNI